MHPGSSWTGVDRAGIDDVFRSLQDRSRFAGERAFVERSGRAGIKKDAIDWWRGTSWNEKGVAELDEGRIDLLGCFTDQQAGR